jgi:thiol:disulfide interchange protein
VHRSVHGSGARLRAGAERGGDLCGVYALALGLAVPYVALTLQPAWTRLLPKPGVWMEVLKQAVAVPIFATAIWLAWVLARAIWRGHAAGAAGELPAAGHCRMVSGPVAGQALGYRGGG